MAGNSSTSAALSVTLDTSAPVVAISNAGGATNQPVQTITGTVDIADAGATVTILDGATVAGTAIVQGNGNWSQSITLNSGSNVLTAQVIDAAGNQGVSNTVTYTLSTTAPVVTEALTFDTGSSATDHITANDALSGTGLASTVVHFTIDGTPIATTVTANAQGAWSFTPSGLTDGAHTIVASQTDTFGNTGSASLTFTLDTTAPSVAITSAGGATNQANQTITGTVDVADAGATVTILDGATVAGTAIVQGNGNWSAPVTLTGGTNSLTAQVIDAAGNQGVSNTVTYTLSTTAPDRDRGADCCDIRLVGDLDQRYHRQCDALSGTAALASTVVGTRSASMGGRRSRTSGSHRHIAQGCPAVVVHADAGDLGPDGAQADRRRAQTDAFGNSSTSASLTFTLDTTAPSGGAPDLVAGSDSGTSSSDNITNATAPSFTVALGSAVAAGDTVELLLGGTSLAHPVVHTVTSADVLSGSVTLAVTAGDLGTRRQQVDLGEVQ